MYQVEVKRLNEQVRRNVDRFPETSRFQLSSRKKMNWSQIATGWVDIAICASIDPETNYKSYFSL